LTDDINSLISTEYVTHYAQPISLVIEPTAQLGIRVYAQTTHPAPVTVHFVYQGSYNVSFFQTGYFVCKEQPEVHFVNKTSALLGIPIVALVMAAIMYIRYRKKDL
jgi:hypothetical protein